MNFDDKLLEVPDSLPLLPVRDIVVFPYMIIPLFVARESSIRSVEEALSKNRLIFLASQKDVTEETPTPESIFEVGTIAMIMRMRKLSDGRVKLLIQGVSKGRISKFNQMAPYFDVAVDKMTEDAVTETQSASVGPILKNAKELVEKVISLGRPLSPDILLVLDDVADPGRVADLIAGNLGLRTQDAQAILELENPISRLQKMIEILNAEIEMLQTQRKNKSPRDEMNKSQRDQYLREQMKAIKNELGENDAKSEELEELREKIQKSGMPTVTETEALKQLSRLERMHPDASEATMVRTYLDWLVDLPWSRSTVDNLDLVHAKNILDDDHYELTKVKERVLEFLAVRKLKANAQKGPMLCFAGPPGVGKTSLGKSIARAMGREYFRISLGGVKDEAEIRGHRRTYVGAMPGKIIQALRQVKTKNPVIVLDEIDKLGSDFRGDPSAAMLEVLDPEQNATFRDNYLNVDFDLSHALFIATANVIENIPAALRDRMELIQIPGYTENDKLFIAQKHLVERQIENNGITVKNIHFTPDGIRSIISGYTREAGLRNLEREIGSVCRKVARMVAMGEADFIDITSQNVSELLGPPKFMRDEKLQESHIGIVQGLAWTQAGGEVLLIEALKMKGKGTLQLTGQLGDVMKESALAAMSYARAHREELNIPEEFFEKFDVHIHLPAGAIPKDGPSAGITLTTALVSLMTDTPVRHDLAMTGEVTLQGRVLPVGGIREKCLAALNQGITTVIVPFANQKDLADIPKVFKDQMKFILAETLDEVFAVAFEKGVREIKKATSGKRDSKKAKAAASAA